MWIVGDFHVFWLDRFVASTEVRFSGSLLECQDCQIASRVSYTRYDLVLESPTEDTS